MHACNNDDDDEVWRALHAGMHYAPNQRAPCTWAVEHERPSLKGKRPMLTLLHLQVDWFCTFEGPDSTTCDRLDASKVARFQSGMQACLQQAHDAGFKGA